MVTVCQLTGFTVMKVLRNKSAPEVLDKFNEIFSQFGLPLGVSSDNGREFKNSLLETFFDKLKVSHNFSTPYRPRTQGQVERINQEIHMKRRDTLAHNAVFNLDASFSASLHLLLGGLLQGMRV